MNIFYIVFYRVFVKEDVRPLFVLFIVYSLITRDGGRHLGSKFKDTLMVADVRSNEGNLERKFPLPMPG